MRIIDKTNESWQLGDVIKNDNGYYGQVVANEEGKYFLIDISPQMKNTIFSLVHKNIWKGPKNHLEELKYACGENWHKVNAKLVIE